MSLLENLELPNRQGYEFIFPFVCSWKCVQASLFAIISLCTYQKKIISLCPNLEHTHWLKYSVNLLSSAQWASYHTLTRDSFGIPITIDPGISNTVQDFINIQINYWHSTKKNELLACMNYWQCCGATQSWAQPNTLGMAQ